MPVGILCAAGIGLAVILILPIRFYVTADNTKGLVVDSNVSYGQGLVSCSFKRCDTSSKAVLKLLGLPVYRFPPAKDSQAVDAGDVPGVIERFKSRKKLLALLPGLARDVIDSVIGRKTEIRLKLGFEDPAYTGMAAGLVACFFSCLSGVLQFTPDFSGDSFKMDLYIKGAVIPAVLVFIGIKYGIVYLREQILTRKKVKGGKRYGFKG